MRDTPLFDTHAHLISGDTDKYPPSPMHGVMRDIDKTDPFDADRLVEEMDGAGVRFACAVQRGHIYGYNNAYILEASRRYPDRLTPVLMVDGLDPETPAILKELAKQQPLGGIRLAAKRIVDLDTAWLNSPQTLKVWETAAELSLPVSVIIFVRHLSYNLPALKLVANLFPDLPIVLDHGGMPHGSGYEVKWTAEAGLPAPYLGAPEFGIPSALLALRPCRNVYYKMTGINVERLNDDNIPLSAFLRHFVNEMGADRIMWGSDVGQTKGEYAGFATDAHSMMAELTDEEAELVAFGTAASVYGLEG